MKQSQRTLAQVRLDVFGANALALDPAKKYEVTVESLDRDGPAVRLIIREVDI